MSAVSPQDTAIIIAPTTQVLSNAHAGQDFFCYLTITGHV